MSTIPSRLLLTLLVGVSCGVGCQATGCQGGAAGKDVVPRFDPREAEPGGKGSVNTRPFPSSELPAHNLPRDLRPAFHAGKALAHQPWVKAPTVTDARDGLGPLYNARTCLDCHVKGGRGHIPDDEKTPLKSSFLRLSVPGEDRQHGAVAEPTYGLQLQTQSIALSHQLRGAVDAKFPSSVPPEASVTVSWTAVPFVYPDGTRRKLRRPVVELHELGYGPLHPQVMMSLRVAPVIHGAGLIELIRQRDLDIQADPDDKNEDGISGRINRVWDFRAKKEVPGRFGYKANRATLEITVAGAFQGDVGIASSLFPNQPCTEAQEQCQRQPHGVNEEGVEITDELLELVVNFNRNLGVPKRTGIEREPLLAGRTTFYELGCAQCHKPSYTTGESKSMPHLAGQLIWPYSDFLLHDLGADLADNRPDYDASGSEWRTTPLWGLGTSAQVSGAESYLHDGRALSMEEAILWHGGEAKNARERFVRLPAIERDRLLQFLATL